MLVRILLTVLLFTQMSPMSSFSSFSGSPYFTLHFQDQEWTLSLSDVGFDGIDPTTLDRQAFRSWLYLVVEKEVNRPPKSATFRNQQIVPHQLGRKVDRKQIENWLDHIHEYMNKRLKLPVIYTKPLLTTEKLKKLKEKKLGSYSTFFDEENKNRAHNIYLSSKAIDHHIVLPGEIFSFNKVVGVRSLERGYQVATIIVKGEYSEGIGGGICQTSSTLFNSVDQAGLKIIEQVSHSKEVAYVPKNRDATVSWGGPDFRFQNQLNEPVLIVSKVRHGKITIQIYGPKTITHVPRKVPLPPRLIGFGMKNKEIIW
ncbi:VanW family protein [Thermoflavimicrobium dichotomicum]|uniref:VanW like protein n=1 Tax=Thermoflavimicrobium dichotomicum TaxID=46223 RepID=A0A1I3NC03_9BACL|nr:VanW family protein [Thermoflavimicrobium dichotomicum]SFJ06871.1 VanW like protein [Thermoflavimicrobium dichotomicum]